MRAAAALASLVLVAQVSTPPRLENQGKPIRVPATCSEEDTQALGLECTEIRPCPLYLELVAVESAGTRLFVSGNLHTTDTTLASILLATEDGGKTWFEPVPRIRGAGLDQIQFYDLETGWIAGHTLTTPPRDPFLLVTTDGGKSWRKRTIYPESRPGLIEAFWFESRTRGVMLLDRIQTGGEGGRYEMYETMTGGDTWSLREVSREPLRVRRPAGEPESRLWRIQTDARTKSFRIEKRTTDGWKEVASFLVEVGACGAKEP